MVLSGGCESSEEAVIASVSEAIQRERALE
jgi:hypothetical protein